MALRSFLLLGTLLGLAACETEKSYAERQMKARAEITSVPPVLVIRHHVGGTHHRAIARGELIYATFANSLLVIGSETGTVLGSVELMPFGRCGGAKEMILAPDESSLFIVLDGTAVVEVSLADPQSPQVVATRHRQEIGFPPRAIGFAGETLYVSGDAGVLRWADIPAPLPPGAPAPKEGISSAPMPMLAAETSVRGPAGPVVLSGEGPVTTVGRRVLRLSDGGYVGAATRLEPIPVAEAERLGLPDQGRNASLFILQAKDGAQVGIMGPDVREMAAGVIGGTVRRVKLLNGRLFATNDVETISWPVERTADGGLALGAPVFTMVKGARDFDRVSENYYFVCGSFGRAFYRLRADGSGPADTFFRASREPSGLIYASTDRRRILAGGPEGSWLYTIGDEVALVNQPIAVADGRRRSVSGPWGRARIADDGQSVEVIPSVTTAQPAPAAAAASGSPNAADPEESGSRAAELTWRPILGGEVFGVESLDNKLWIWHADGIDVLAVDLGQLEPEGSVQVEGPVRYFFPQRVGGAAAFVSEFGGFGVLDFIERDALPTVSGERVVDLDGDGDDDVELSPRERLGESISNEATRPPVPLDDAGSGLPPTTRD
jgi:hypothetical protein